MSEWSDKKSDEVLPLLRRASYGDGHSHKVALAAMQIITRLEAENRRLLKLLAPFAKEAAVWIDTIPNSYRPGVTEPKSKYSHARAEFNLGHLRAARKAVEETAENRNG